METTAVENGKIEDAMMLDGFKIHDTMFNIKDVIQCLFLCSKTMYEYFHRESCNIFIITVSRDGSFVVRNAVIN